jgi:glycosyltransferase involved in cell wall biosynthesis
MKRIYMLSSAHPPFDKRIFMRESRTLSENNYEVTHICPHEKKEIRDNVKILPIPKSRNRLMRMLRTWRIFSSASKVNADLYHFHDPELLPFGLLLKWMKRKPVVYDVHEYNAFSILTKHWIPSFIRKPVSLLVDRMEKFAARRLSGVITVNDHMKDMFLPYNENSVDVCNYPVLKDLKLKMAPNQDKKTIIYLGYVSMNRGLETILETIPHVKEKHPDAEFLLVGPLILGSVSVATRDKLNQYKEKKYVKATGEVPFHQAMGYLQQSSIGWIPLLPTLNYQHAKVIKLFEYALYGKPIVASRIGFIADLIKEMKCGVLVDPFDAREHARAINFLLEHTEEARSMGEKGKQAVLDRYNWEKESKKMLKLYEKLLGEN